MTVTEGEREERRVTQYHLQRRTESIKPRQVAETGAIPFRMWGCEALNSMGLGTRRARNEVESAVRTNGGGGHGPIEKIHFNGHLVDIDP